MSQNSQKITAKIFGSLTYFDRQAGRQAGRQEFKKYFNASHPFGASRRLAPKGCDALWRVNPENNQYFIIKLI